jgi:hypothetical protein
MWQTAGKVKVKFTLQEATKVHRGVDEYKKLQSKQ